MATEYVRPEVISASLTPTRFPRQVVRYSPFGFGYGPATNTTVAASAVNRTGGVGSLQVTGTSGTTPAAVKTLTGLVPGQLYWVSAWARAAVAYTGSWQVQFNVVGFGPGEPVTLQNDGTTWTTVGYYGFTATRSTHTLRLEATFPSPDANVLWDDVRIQIDPLNSDYMRDTFDWFDGWVGAPNAASITFARSSDGDYSSLLISRGAVATTVTAKRTYTGLTVGRTYSVHTRANASIASTTATISVTGGTTSTTYTLPTASNSWQVMQHTFTATATSHEVVISGINAGATALSVYIEGVYLFRDAYIDGAQSRPLSIAGGTITLDRGWSPHIRGDIVVPLTTVNQSHETDVRTPLRVSLVTAAASSGMTEPPTAETTRTFNLGVRERDIDYKSKTIRLSLASDEALLMDYARVATTADTAPVALAGSLRSVCNWALGKIGASLAASPNDDVDLTPYWPLTNLVTNPNCLSNVTGYLAGSGCTIAWNSGTGAISGTGFLRATVSATTATVTVGPSLSGTDSYPVVGGRKYVISYYVKNSTVAGNATISVQWVYGDGTISGVYSGTLTALTTSFARISRIVTAPIGAVGMRVQARGTSLTSGQLLDMDCFSIVEDSELQPYFDGSTNDTAQYAYGWDDTAAPNASSSTRTPVVDRPRETFWWMPGQTLWDFLTPLLDQAALRLYCDEARVWRLLDPDNISSWSIVTVQTGQNLIEARDTISRNDETWADSVVLLYRWVDPSSGTTKERYDVAGTPGGRTYTHTYEDTPFPGPGAAAFVLKRFQVRGRRSEVTRSTSLMVSAYNYQVWLYLPNEPYANPFTAEVTAVQFDLFEGTMALTLETVEPPDSPPALVLGEGPLAEKNSFPEDEDAA